MRGPARENVLSGVSVQEITPETRKAIGIPGNVEGVIVTGVQPNSPASGTLMRNDIIREVDRKEIRSIEDYQIAVSAIGPGEGVLLLVNREGRNIYITIRP